MAVLQSTKPTNGGAAQEILTSRRATRESCELSPKREGGAGMKEALEEMPPVEVQGTLSAGRDPLPPSDGSDFLTGDSRKWLKVSSWPCRSPTPPPPSADSPFLTGEARNPLRDKSGVCKASSCSRRISATPAMSKTVSCVWCIQTKQQSAEVINRVPTSFQ